MEKIKIPTDLQINKSSFDEGYHRGHKDGLNQGRTERESEVKALLKALMPFKKMAESVFSGMSKNKTGILYSYNWSEIKYEDLKVVFELSQKYDIGID
jgi:hypothetical protein